MRRAAKVDESQEEIIKGLRKVGASVEFIGKPLDLLVCCRGRTFLMEVKTDRPTSEGGKHGLTEDQVKFIARWPGEYHVVANLTQALTAALGEKAMR